MELHDSAPAHKGEHESVAQRILGTLRREIVTARLEPGQIIQETETASRLGVSKTPVREALQTLLSEGFVMVFPRRGYVVRPLGLNDIREIMDLRMSIEPPITGVAARLSTIELVRKLEKILSHHVDESLGFAERLQAANEFHRTIASTAGNKRAGRLLNTYLDETTRIHYMFSRAMDHVVSPVELHSHRQIVDAIADKDELGAREAMSAHLRESNEALLQSFY
ncbi:GntR family transcriptional regulator [Nesterenkonia lutea]|uniref:DNA-binding GntR family transcriptional regulator n=1 Tax=Nesterenkonia lutea TaxID=272919 RepID=A0ABR9JEL7_9MICC|nr:DNA-binding GntR family transcriptional regulator [Nesterenkonia lutea]